MTGVESIQSTVDTPKSLIIRIDFPVIGSIKQEFLVEKTGDTEDFIEWLPAKTENKFSPVFGRIIW